MPHLQFDIVLQKQNLSPHEQVHAAMYMPSHGEFLLECLARTGLKPGLIFGLDDFALNGQCLNQSSSEILIVCGADQHLSQGFLQTWQQLRKRYQQRVLIVSEPIYSPLAYWQNPQQNAASQHEAFLAAFEPQTVLYLSRYDLLEAQKRYGSQLQALLYSLADPELLAEPLIPWADKQQALLWLGKPAAWAFNRQHEYSWSREQQLAYFVQQQRLPFEGFSQRFTFRECYLMSNRYRFQLQPRSGYAFHTARTVQAAITGSIPVILLHPDYLEILAIEAPFARPGENCLLGLDGDYDSLLDTLQDQAVCARIAQRVRELLVAGTVQQGVFELVQQLFQRSSQAP